MDILSSFVMKIEFSFAINKNKKNLNCTSYLYFSFCQTCKGQSPRQAEFCSV